MLKEGGFCYIGRTSLKMVSTLRVGHQPVLVAHRIVVLREDHTGAYRLFVKDCYDY